MSKATRVGDEVSHILIDGPVAVVKGVGRFFSGLVDVDGRRKRREDRTPELSSNELKNELELQKAKLAQAEAMAKTWKARVKEGRAEVDRRVNKNKAVHTEATGSDS